GAPSSLLDSRRLHDALPISGGRADEQVVLTEPVAVCEVADQDGALPAVLLHRAGGAGLLPQRVERRQPEVHHALDLLLVDLVEADRQSTRLNSSHVKISYAV